MVFTQKIYILFALIFLSFSNDLLAQKRNVPGYLGKRAFLEYNPALGAVASLNESSLVIAHSLHFQYIVKRRLQLGLSFDPHNFSSDSGTFSSGLSEIKGNAVGINIDWYRKDLIAPVGMYLRLEYKRLSGDFTQTFNNGSQGTSPESETEGYNHDYLGVGYGIHRIIQNRIVFNVGGTLGGVFGNADNSSRYFLGTIYGIRLQLGLGVLLF